MEIVKAFSENNLHTEITIKGTPEEPLFRASDIGEILGLSNIRVTIKDYNETQKKCVSNPYSGNSTVTFLTEKGLYKVLFSVRKNPIAEKFQDWCCDIIKEIRLTGEYKLNKEVQELKNEITQKNNIIFELEEEVENTKNEALTNMQLEIKNHFLDSLNLREETILEQYKENIQCIYYGSISNTIKDLDNEKYVKFGKSNNLPYRTKRHKKTYNDFYLVNAFKVENDRQIENAIKRHPLLFKHLRKLKIPDDDETHLEILSIDKELTFEKLDEIIKSIIESIEYTPENYKKLLDENEKLLEFKTDCIGVNNIYLQLSNKNDDNEDEDEDENENEDDGGDESDIINDSKNDEETKIDKQNKKVDKDNIKQFRRQAKILLQGLIEPTTSIQMEEQLNALRIQNKILHQNICILETSLSKKHDEYETLRAENAKENKNLKEELALTKTKLESLSYIPPSETEIPVNAINPNRKIKIVPKQSDIFPLQKINIETKEIIFVYDNLCDCLKKNEHLGFNANSINYAAAQCKERYGFLWRFIDGKTPQVENENESEDKEELLDENEFQVSKKVSQPKKQGYVAKLNSQKTEIVNLYVDTASACSLNKFPKNFLNRYIDRNKFPTNSTNYYYHFYDLSVELQNNFIEKCGGFLPTLFSGGNGVGVFDEKHKLVKVYSTSTNLRVQERLSQHCIETHLNKNKMFEHRYLKSVPDNPSIF